MDLALNNLQGLCALKPNQTFNYQSHGFDANGFAYETTSLNLLVGKFPLHNG